MLARLEFMKKNELNDGLGLRNARHFELTLKLDLKFEKIKIELKNDCDCDPDTFEEDINDASLKAKIN